MQNSGHITSSEVEISNFLAEFSAEPLTKNLEGVSYSINSAIFFQNSQIWVKQAKARKLEISTSELVMCPLFCIAKHAKKSIYLKNRMDP
jgi:hypothetical protein